MLAVTDSQPIILKLLVDAGADLNIAGEMGYTALSACLE